MSVAENSKFISLVADNGTEFVAEQKAIFTIHPDIGFVKGKDSYISFDLLNNDSNGRVNILPATAGAGAVIDRLDVFSLANGQLLESLTNYNLWCSLENQYLEEDDQHSEIKYGTAPKCRAYDISQNKSTKVNTLDAVGHHTNPRSTFDENSMNLSTISSGAGTGGANTETNVDTEMCAKKFTSRKYCIPIKSGIFSHFGVSEKLTPILLFGGLRLEITFAANERVMTRASVGTSSAAIVKATEFGNGIPVNRVQAIGANTGVNTGLQDSTLKSITITADCADPATLGIVKGANMTIRREAAGAEQNFVVSHVHRQSTNAGVATNKVTLITTANLTDTGAGGGEVIYFQSSTRAYKLKNVELKVLQVIPPQKMLKGIIKESQYDFISWDCFLDNLPKESTTHQSDINSVASAAKCIFTHYINVSRENVGHDPNYYAGNPPHNTFLNSIQYFINNKLYPLKPYNPDAKQDKVVNMNEVVKSFQTIGKQVKRLGDCRGGNISDYTNTYLHARELARGEQFVFNLKDAEPQIRLEFAKGRDSVPEGTGGVAMGNGRIIHFVFSVKTIMINKDNLQLLL